MKKLIKPDEYIEDELKNELQQEGLVPNDYDMLEMTKAFLQYVDEGMSDYMIQCFKSWIEDGHYQDFEKEVK